MPERLRASLPGNWRMNRIRYRLDECAREQAEQEKRLGLNPHLGTGNLGRSDDEAVEVHKGLKAFEQKMEEVNAWFEKNGMGGEV